MKVIEAHGHIGAVDETAVAALRDMNVKVLNICVAHDPKEDWRATQVPAFMGLRERWPDRFAWVTTFDPPLPEDFERPDEYATRLMNDLREDFAAGALACKVWKNIGMEIRKPDGECVMVDDPLFRPVFEFLEQARKPLIAHIGEPLACWQPLSDDNLHSGYYRQHPEWHMYSRSDVPHHSEQVASLERLAAAHRDLTIVAAHMAALEYDTDEAARRLDAHPNLAMDTAARIKDLAAQDPDKVAAFLTKYRSRILFGTDLVFGREAAYGKPVDFDALRRRIAASYGDAAGGVVVPGVELADAVAEDILHRNAERWIPGV
jgi:predicted TIM-barrel fold metal-dependent hydrolase